MMSKPAIRYYAHSVSGESRSEWQDLRDHLLSVASGARSRAEKFGAGTWGEAAGLLHDLGKYSAEFQARLSGAAASVDHSTAGAQVARLHYGQAGLPIAAAVAGHHAGLANGSVNGERTPLASRLASAVPDYSAWEGELELPQLTPPRLAPHPTEATSRAGLQLATFSRMIFSSLIDADWSDTGAFISASSGVAKVEAERPSPAILLAALANSLDALRREAAPTRLNRVRDEILSVALARATKPTGVFTMTVPTGGGKTLASLAFALEHAKIHQLDRVIYVAPYCAIIDQTADVFRRVLRPHGNAVVEHHSAFREPRTRAQRMTAEAWDAPVIVTTAVQFFESLFSDRPSRCRKLHNIARSVVILDEAQTMPLRLLRPCVGILDELTRNYGVSVMLCTATQPALIERPESPERSFLGGFQAVREIAPAPTRLYRSLRRVIVRHSGAMTDAQVASDMESRKQALAIVNTRSHARKLVGCLHDVEGAAHLSTLMCAAHRRQRLAAIRERLKDDLPVALVSTSLIEAGVDVDFRAVWRAMAGLDQIAQAAGRCNREGRFKPSSSIVTVFEPEHPEPRYMRSAADASREILRHYNDALSLPALEAYFRRAYWSRQIGGDGLDADAILPRLNAQATDLLFPHEDVARDMRLIEDESEAILIPFDDNARRLIGALPSADNRGLIARRLQPYTVNVYPKNFDVLRAAGWVVSATDDEQFWVLARGDHYRQDVGLNVEGVELWE
jgi:CRISPR-associated endonuclease/helicase Cas3